MENKELTRDQKNGYLCGESAYDCIALKSTMEDCRGNCVMKKQEPKKGNNPKVTISYCSKCKSAITVSMNPGKEFYKEVQKFKLDVKTTTLNKYKKNPPVLFQCNCLTP